MLLLLLYIERERHARSFDEWEVFRASPVAVFLSSTNSRLRERRAVVRMTSYPLLPIKTSSSVSPPAAGVSCRSGGCRAHVNEQTCVVGSRTTEPWRKQSPTYTVMYVCRCRRWVSEYVGQRTSVVASVNEGKDLPWWRAIFVGL